MLLEVSQKQSYIFASRSLKDNLRRSAEIRYVTGNAYFSESCPDLYCSENMVYSGGGHTVLQFPDGEAAKRFAGRLTGQALRDFPDMELFVKLLKYDPALKPEENLIRLSAALEKKKAERRAAFRRLRFGVEASEVEPPAGKAIQQPQPAVPAGWRLTSDLGRLAGNDNFIAVIHLDGNAMGRRLQSIYEHGGSWEDCVRLLRTFSDGIDRDYASAYDETAKDLADALEKQNWPDRILPMRKLIGAGDDVCFVCAGDLGLECAVSFLENLRNRKNPADGRSYTACAGVVLVHKKYPFRVAYDLSEQLCSNAKRYGARLCEDGSVCALDWHVEFGQLKGELGAIREGYTAQDGTCMTLRPLVVSGGRPPIERSYEYFRAVAESLQARDRAVLLARSKLKALRTAFQQGRQETELALRSTRTEDLLWNGFEKRHPDWLRKTVGGERLQASAYMTDHDGETPRERCLYFDAMEIADHLNLWRGDRT